jgi:protein-L-isoaspartate(D-aspartate) O-methyltransferase
MILARLLESADIKPNEIVLDIAPATGYSTAVIASLAKEVVAVEPDQGLKMQAVSNLGSVQIINADVQTGKAVEGYKAKAPYDVIIINGGVEFVPEALTDQLAEGGRLFAIVREYGPGHAAHTGEARLYEKVRGQVSHRPLFDANVKLLAGFSVPKKFKF